MLERSGHVGEDESVLGGLDMIEEKERKRKME